MNKPVFLLWVSINIKGQKNFRLSFPMPLPVLQMIADMAEDLAIIFVFFSPKKRISSPKRDSKTPAKIVSTYVMPGLRVLRNILTELEYNTGPFDLADIHVGDSGDKVNVKLSLR